MKNCLLDPKAFIEIQIKTNSAEVMSKLGSGSGNSNSSEDGQSSEPGRKNPSGMETSASP